MRQHRMLLLAPLLLIATLVLACGGAISYPIYLPVTQPDQLTIPYPDTPPTPGALP